MDPSQLFPHGDIPWTPLTDAEFMALTAHHHHQQQPSTSTAAHSGTRINPRVQAGPVPPQYLTGQTAGPSTANLDLLASLSQNPSAGARSGQDVSNQALINALRLVVNGAISPQDVSHLLPQDIARQIHGGHDPSSQGFASFPPNPSHAHYPNMHPPMHPQQEPLGPDPSAWWLPPPPPPPHASFPNGLPPAGSSYAFPSTTLSTSSRRTSTTGPSMTASASAGPSATRGRTRSASARRAVSVSSSPAIAEDRSPQPQSPAALAREELEDGQDGEEDDNGQDEDKRRRNTAASARFRMKKKQQVVNLERTISDLTGRADELEREAADLRRENGWLKEIVMLKGRTHGGQLGLPPPHLPDMGGDNSSGMRQ